MEAASASGSLSAADQAEIEQLEERASTLKKVWTTYRVLRSWNFSEIVVGFGVHGGWRLRKGMCMRNRTMIGRGICISIKTRLRYPACYLSIADIPRCHTVQTLICIASSSQNDVTFSVI